MKEVKFTVSPNALFDSMVAIKKTEQSDACRIEIMGKLIFIQDLKDYADERKEQGYLKCYFSNFKIEKLYQQGYFETDIVYTINKIGYLHNTQLIFDDAHNLYEIVADIYHKKQVDDDDL